MSDTDPEHAAYCDSLKLKTNPKLVKTLLEDEATLLVLGCGNDGAERKYRYALVQPGDIPFHALIKQLLERGIGEIGETGLTLLRVLGKKIVMVDKAQIEVAPIPTKVKTHNDNGERLELPLTIPDLDAIAIKLSGQ